MDIVERLRQEIANYEARSEPDQASLLRDARDKIINLQTKLALVKPCGCQKREDDINQLFSEWEYYVAKLEN